MIELFGKVPEMVLSAIVALPVGSALIFAWQRFRGRVFDARSARGVFHFTADPTHVFLPLTSPSDGGAASGYGDLLALVELIAVTERLHRSRNQISVYPGQNEIHPSEILTHQNIISIGGYKHNWVYRDLIMRLDPPFHFWHQDQPRAHAIRNKDGTTRFQPLRNRDGQIIRDVGIALRAPSPYNPGKMVVLVAGAHTFGSVAAMKYLCDPQTGRSLVSAKGQRAMVVVACDVEAHRVGTIKPVSDIIEW